MNREGVILLIFDLPSVTKSDKRNYRKFRKYLIGNGFVMIQQSVYVKLLHNISSYKSDVSKLKLISPKKGNVSIFPMSLNNFKRFINISGNEFNMKLFCEPILYLTA